MKRISILLLFIPFLAAAQPNLSLEEYASGFNRPSEITHAGDERLFVSEQTGRIYILSPDGEELPSPFLNISNRVDANGNEKGLLGLAFPPDYCTTGVFYVNYTNTTSGQLYTRISRFTVDPDDENLALANSEEIVMQYEQDFSNHNGGHIEFGSDGYLYIGNGDGGSGGDPNNNAQNIMSPLGKMLRIDVSTEPYSIPADNPYANDDFGMDEIWSYGLRNPWKFAFDKETGDMYIGDVGQNQIEEVDFEPAGSIGGINYGWRCYEGDETYDMSECAGTSDVTYPFHQFVHSNQGNGSRCSITGGRVYRGNSFPELQGKYIYTDYCSDEYWVASQDGEEWDIFYGAELGNGVVSFGEDLWGEIYALSGVTGKVYKVIDASGEWLEHVFLDSFSNLHSTLSGSSYQWYFNGEPIADSDAQMITFTGNGIYSVVITTESGCTVEANALDLSSLSAGNNELVQQFQVYPNPSKGLINLNINADSSLGQITLKVISIEGKELLITNFESASTATSIDLSGFQKGIYFVHLTDKSGRSLGVRKVSINQ